MQAGRRKRSGRFWVYLVRCRGGALYTGIATDVERRLAEHRGGRGAKALRGRGPLELVLARAVGGRGHAQRVEALVKRLGKAEKEQLAARARLLKPLIEAARRAGAAARAAGDLPRRAVSSSAAHATATRAPAARRARSAARRT